MLSAREVGSLKEWRASPAYEAFRKLVETQATTVMEAVLAGAEGADMQRQRGRLDAYTDVYTLADRTIRLLGEYYDRQSAREQQQRLATDRRSRHVSSPYFWGGDRG